MDDQTHTVESLNSYLARNPGHFYRSEDGRVIMVQKAIDYYIQNLRPPGVNIAQVAYEAYCAHTGGVSLVSGATLPEWGKLSQEIQEAWNSAAHAVRWSV